MLPVQTCTNSAQLQPRYNYAALQAVPNAGLDPRIAHDQPAGQLRIANDSMGRQDGCIKRAGISLLGSIYVLCWDGRPDHSGAICTGR